MSQTIALFSDLSVLWYVESDRKEMTLQSSNGSSPIALLYKLLEKILLYTNSLIILKRIFAAYLFFTILKAFCNTKQIFYKTLMQQEEEKK